jgi:thymidylate kinase
MPDFQLVLPGLDHALAPTRGPRRRRLSPEKGGLLVFEGPDRTGKSTISKLVAAHLTQIGFNCLNASFPGREEGTLGKLIYDLHHDRQSHGPIIELSAASLQTAHIAAHIDQIERLLWPAIKSGKLVILDRFWWSTWVYGITTGVSVAALTKLIELERHYWNRIKPSMLFLFQRELGLSEQYEEYARLSDEYNQLLAREDGKYPIKTINNTGDLDQIALTIVQMLNIHQPQRRKKTNSNVNQTSEQSDLISSGRGSADQVTPILPSNMHGSLRNECYPREVQLHSSGGQTHETIDNQEPHLPPPRIYINRLSEATPTLVFDTYWLFAAERQEIFFRRMHGLPQPWTNDPILQEHKFTNAYRASDRVSQFLIQHVIENSEQTNEELFFRIILFKIFNKIETWNLLINTLGNISYREYKFEHYDQILTRAIEKKTSIYSAAYIMPSGGPASGVDRKHRMHLMLIERMMQDGLPNKVAAARSMSQAYELLLSYPSIGKFLAYQYVTDLNYSNIIDFDEMSFVIPGPGASDGIRKCFSNLGGLDETNIIRRMTESQSDEFARLGIRFRNLWGRQLHLIDCQNLFCEVDKYARVKHPEFSGCTGRTRIKQKFHRDPSPLKYWYPRKWNINARIPEEFRHVPSPQR